MFGSKLTTLQKNRSEWEKQQPKFQQMTYELPPGGNPWKESEGALKKMMTKPLAHTYGMTKREQNEYLKQHRDLNSTKEFYKNGRPGESLKSFTYPTKDRGYYGPC